MKKVLKSKFFKSYGYSLILLSSIIIGFIIGLIFKEKANILKPLGDLFVNLMFTIVVPLVFFTISSSIAGMQNMKRLGKIISSMFLVFISTGVVANLY